MTLGTLPQSVPLTTQKKICVTSAQQKGLTENLLALFVPCGCVKVEPKLLLLVQLTGTLSGGDN